LKVVIKNTATLRALLRKISRNLPEAAINFAKDRITIFGMDERSILAGKLTISKQQFEYQGYKPINNIALNLDNLCSILEKLKGEVTLELKSEKIVLSAGKKGVRKEFSLGIMKLGNRHVFPKWKPIVSWNTDGKIGALKRISMHVNKGPLVIDSEQDGCRLSWIIAPVLAGRGD
jgi:hypothetical protein